MTDGLESKIKQTLSVVLNIPEENLPDDAEPGSPDAWDSLKHMTFILTLEEEFGIRFTDGELVDLLNLKLIGLTVAAKLSE